MQFPVARTDPYSPPAAYLAAADAAPRRVRLAYGGQAWLVTGYHDARAILSDGRFSSDATRPGYPNFPLASKRPIPGHFLAMDPPEHTRFRKLVASAFTGSAVRALRPGIREHAESLITAMMRHGSPADLIESVAVTLPALVAADLLGVPATDRPMFQTVARDLQLHEATAARRAVAGGRMSSYLDDLITAKQRADGGDLLSRLARPVTEAERLPRADLVGMANLILVAGLETTAGLLGLTVLALLRHRRQGELVRTDPERWSEPAVAESLRYWTVVQHGVARVATCDVEVAGTLIQAGDAVVVHLPAANWDPAVYPEPARFDVTRDAHAHLAFGHGMHRCLGGALAQLQAGVALAELIRLLPRLRLLDPAAEPPFRHDMLVYGVRELPVTW
jgi:cytochrome P450